MIEQSDQKVQLGCGTLILIALIVAMFSGGKGTSDLRSEVRVLERKIDGLEAKINVLTAKIDQQQANAAAVAEKPLPGNISN